MPSEFASAIADLRLSPEKLSQDAAAIQGQLLRITQQLERQATINIAVGIDVTQARRDLNRAVARLTSVGAFKIPVGLDADDAVDEIAALQGIVDPITMSVLANTDQAVDDIIGLQDLAEPVVVPFDVDPADAYSAMDSVANTALPDTVAAFEAAGDASGRGFADRLTGAVKVGLGSLSIAVGGFVATALVTGFQRLTTIEDATAALTVALGDATEAAGVLDDVLGVVTGTPYNLDQFALAASNLISFGVEAEKVPGYLTAIGEAAASRGSRANEFAQRLSDTFGQVSVQGRIMGEDLLSLQATGVDALRILGNEFGKTTIEIREMVSEGAVPADEALQILADGILNGTTGINGATVAFAGTMEKLRQTLTGSIGGFKSATARFGAAIIDPLQGVLTTGFRSATEIVNGFNQSITETLGNIADSDGFDRFETFIEELPDKIDPLIESLSSLGPALAPLAAAFGALGLGQLQNILGPLGTLVPAINPIVAAIGAFVALTPEIREELMPVLVDLGESVAILGVGLGDALGEVLDDLIPLMSDFIGVIGDFTPILRSAAVAGVGLAQGIVPVLGTLAEILDGFPVEVLTAIGVGFLAFKAIGALRSPFDALVGRLDGVSNSLIAAEDNAEQFGNRWTATAERVGISWDRVARVNDALVKSLNVASVAAVGFFSGMAASSDDATVQITGFVGAATGIAAAFARTGVVGGLVTTAATVGGALVKTWTDSKQAAEEYRDFLDEVANDIIEDLGAATAALLEAQDLVAQISFQDAAVELVGEEQLRRLDDMDIKLGDILDLTTDTEFADGLRGQVEAAAKAADAAAAVFADRQLQETGSQPSPEEVGQVYAENFLFGLEEVIANTPELDLSQLISTTNLEGGGFEVVAGGLYEFIDTLDELGALNADELERLADVAQNAVIDFEASISSLLRLSTGQAETFRERIDAMGLDYDDLIEKIKGNEAEVERLLGLAFSSIDYPAGTGPIDVIIAGLESMGEEAEAVESDFDGVRNAAEDMADVFESAMERADRATRRLDESLQEMLGTLDEITRQQDFAAGFRNIGEALDEITNTDALRDAEKLVDDIARQRDSIFDLQAKIAEEQGAANILAADYDRRIQEAIDIGSTTVLATLQAQRDAVFIDVNNLQTELDRENAELANLQSNLAAAETTPVTLGDLLEDQANQYGLSLFKFLLEAPTEESRDFFQRQLAPQLQEAGELIQAAIDESPLLASIEIPNILDALVDGFIAEGVTPEVANKLVGKVFDDAGGLAEEAVDAFEAGFTADVAQLQGLTAKILSNEPIDSSVDVDAIVTDVGDGIAELQALQAQGLDIPGDIDLQEAQDTLVAFQDAMDTEDFALVIPIEGDITGIIEDLEALQAYALSLSIADTQRALNSPGGGGGGRLTFQEDGGILQFFRHGGFTENHIAQLARTGTIRVWHEPETGGEAYIPMAKSKRPRSERILADVAAEFGLAVTRMPTGLAGADIEDAVARGASRGLGSLQSGADDYDRSTHMDVKIYGATKPLETAREIRRRFVKGRR